MQIHGVTLFLKSSNTQTGKSFTCLTCFLKAYFWRESSLLKNLWVSKKRQSESFIGDRARGIVSRLFPYSNYKLEMVVVNGRGDGPRSEIKEFTTPEGGRFLHNCFVGFAEFTLCVKYEGILELCECSTLKIPWAVRSGPIKTSLKSPAFCIGLGLLVP